MADILIKRAYELFKKSDGFRILVDCQWARDVKKEVAKTGLWLKEIAPSPASRKWFSHDAKK